MKLDDEIVELEEWDAVRLPPGTWRGYEAGPEGLEILVIGAPNLGEDPRGDIGGRRDWWADQPLARGRVIRTHPGTPAVGAGSLRSATSGSQLRA
jgi:hypothetical protein